VEEAAAGLTFAIKAEVSDLGRTPEQWLEQPAASFIYAAQWQLIFR
jgi:hypothetical protein